jgi:hypothetical protein
MISGFLRSHYYRNLIYLIIHFLSRVLNFNKKFLPLFPVFIFLTLVIRNGGISLKHILRFFSHILRFVLLEPLRLLELIMFHKRIVKHELSEDPIFVLGHWRSGTSHLQALLRQDSRTTSIGIYSSVFSGNFLLSSSFIKPVAQWICKLLRIQYTIQRTPLDLDYPGEMDTGLCFLPNLYSYTWGNIFPRKFKEHMELSVFNDDPEMTVII